jgi:4-amino-4-deoxy-L-arabinose transferase-like glycosyltransferase
MAGQNMAGRATWLAGRRPYLLLGALCLCLYLPGLAAIPVTDRDEARFAQATRQMLETGDYLRIRFQDEARNNKPAGIYWLQAAAVAALSTPEATAIWPYRLPSLIGATLAVLFTFGFGRALLRNGPQAQAAPGTAFAAAAILASALGTIAEAHLAKTDAVLLAAIVAGQGALGLCYVRRGGGPVGPGIATAFWLAQIAAALLKGPVGPGLAIVTAATLSIADRDASWLRGLRPAAGIAAVALAIGPWLWAIEHATAGRFLDDSLGRDFLAKIVGAREAHGAPPFYYLALSVLTFWPGSLFLGPALIGGWRRHEQRLPRFLLAWLVPAWVIVELVPTKLPHYVLPLYPALALLVALALAGGWRDPARWARWVGGAVTALWALATVGIAAALIVLPIRFGDGISGAGIAGAAALAALMAALLFRRAAVPLLPVMALAMAVPAAQWVVPGLDQLWLSRAAAAMLAHHPPADGKAPVVIGYSEPSLVFLLGNRLQISTAGAASSVAEGGEALVNARQAATFEQALAVRGLAARPIDSVRGTDYSNGHRLELTLYRIERK